MTSSNVSSEEVAALSGCSLLSHSIDGKVVIRTVRSVPIHFTHQLHLVRMSVHKLSCVSTSIDGTNALSSMRTVSHVSVRSEALNLALGSCRRNFVVVLLLKLDINKLKFNKSLTFC